jgi:transcriptional regulator with XRE-family HTH domain
MANPVDVHVGAKLRLIRNARGMSQAELGKQVGVAFQQIQKYERGDNRVSASMLFMMANALKISIADFFSGLDADFDPAIPVMPNKPLTVQSIKLATAFEQIEDSAARNQILKLINTLASSDEQAA